jgi:hypothetical protein
VKVPFNYTDRSRDFAYLAPGTTPYTLRVAGQPDVVLPSVLAEPVTYKEALPADGMVQQGDLLAVWPLAASQPPPLGAKLIDSEGTVWTILTVLRKWQVNTWECTARNLAVACNLNNFATVLKAQYTKSPAGAAVATWTPLGPAIAARFQPQSQDAQIFEDAEWTRTRFTVVLSQDILDWLGYPVELSGSNYRLMDQQGRHYRVTSYQQAQRIDVLPTAAAVLVLEGAEGLLAAFPSSSASSSGT